MHRIAPAAALALMLTACATTPRPAPIDVTRYHLGSPVAQGSVTVEPQTYYAGVTPEDNVYATAITDALAARGFTLAADKASAAYVASFAYTRTSRGTVRTRPPVTIGIGGGSFGGNVGVGGGASFGIGGHRAELYDTELKVQLKRTGDMTVVWEGRAVTEGLSGAHGETAAETASRLAQAMFKDFPGESGITITVK